jgi:hypothetical protein
MLMGGLEALAEGSEGRGERREGRPAGREALGQLAARGMPEMARYFKRGAPYGPTNEGMMRWISERAASATAAAEERLAPAASPPMQASLRAYNNAAEGVRIRSFAEGERIRSFAEGERIRSFAEGEQ